MTGFGITEPYLESCEKLLEKYIEPEELGADGLRIEEVADELEQVKTN